MRMKVIKLKKYLNLLLMVICIMKSTLKLNSILRFSACFHEKFDQQCVILKILPIFLLNYEDFKKNSNLKFFYFPKFISWGNIR
jgi:hypothetical protein